jgi:hypothetical protein
LKRQREKDEALLIASGIRERSFGKRPPTKK